MKTIHRQPGSFFSSFGIDSLKGLSQLMTLPADYEDRYLSQAMKLNKWTGLLGTFCYLGWIPFDMWFAPRNLSVLVPLRIVVFFLGLSFFPFFSSRRWNQLISLI